MTQYYFYQAFLLLCKTKVISTIILSLLFSKHRKQVLNCALLLFISIIINKILKFYFHVPLNSELNSPGFAYPSGHMQATIVFYGELAFTFRKKIIWLLVMLANFGVAQGLVYFKYHNWEDIFAAILTGISILVTYQAIKRYSNYKNIVHYLSWLLYQIFIVLIVFMCWYQGNLPKMFYYIIPIASLIVVYSQYNRKKLSKFSNKY